jgi:predicted small metal-binding protein
MSVIQQNSSDNFEFIVNQAITEGTQQFDAIESELEVTLEFTDEQLQIIQELSQALELSVMDLLDSAISFVYFNKDDREVKQKLTESIKYLNNQSSLNNDTKNSIKYRLAHVKKMTLTALVTHKLEVLDMKERVYECVVTGIYLLYERLIPKQPKVAS